MSFQIMDFLWFGLVVVLSIFWPWNLLLNLFSKETENLRDRNPWVRTNI